MITHILEGVCVYGAVHGVIWACSKLLNDTDRQKAIWSHHAKRGKGLGHTSRNPLSCSDDQCATI